MPRCGGGRWHAHAVVWGSNANGLWEGMLCRRATRGPHVVYLAPSLHRRSCLQRRVGVLCPGYPISSSSECSTCCVPAAPLGGDWRQLHPICVRRTVLQDGRQKTALTKACETKDTRAVLNLVAAGASLDLQVQLQLRTPPPPKRHANLQSLPRRERAVGHRTPVPSAATRSLVPPVHRDCPPLMRHCHDSYPRHALAPALCAARAALTAWTATGPPRIDLCLGPSPVPADRCRRIATA